MDFAFFQVSEGSGAEILEPLPASDSKWAPDQIRGMAVSGALARATERRVVSVMGDEMRPARWSLDLFRRPLTRSSTITTTVIRHGRRIALIDAELRQAGRAVARSKALFVRPSATPEGAVWSPPYKLDPPPPDLLPRSEDPTLYYSDEVGWTIDPSSHRNDTRKQTWHFPIPIVTTESLTPFQLVASVADVTSLVVNWGSAGVQFVNADISLALSRVPTSMEVGVATSHRWESSGISVGTALIFDRAGALGSASVVGLAHVPHRLPTSSGAEHP